ncbi:MAG TPA: CotH kinase family protein [Polyangia bacterium]|nr:CotH kinase family protein [Polyangia bacterium]
MTPQRRLYRMRPLTAALLCLPGLLLCGWYAWKAFSGLDGYRRFTDPERSLALEDFQISLHDALTADLRRLTMPPSPEPSRLERLVLRMGSDAVDALFGDPARADAAGYVKAELETGGKLQEVEVRVRGTQHWNVLGQQRSLKVRLPQGELYDGHRVFNLINDPSPMVVGEELILDLARESGILTPRSDFVRVLVNGADLGVLRFETPPDEGLLRLRRRMPGSIYSSNLPSGTSTDELWDGARHWNKVAWREEAAKDDLDELDRLLSRLAGDSVRRFADFARHEVDLEAFAAHEALDMAFGGDQHDFRDNHKLYFDPYRGRFEPVAWNFRGFKHERRLDLVENPILLRLKLVPEYLTARARALHGLLAGEGRVEAVRRRGRKALRRLAPELASDRWFDAYKMLPGIDRFHRQMMRPMDLEHAALVFESELATYAARHAFLTAELERNPLWIEVGQARPSAPAPSSEQGPNPTHVMPVSFVIDGHAGVKLEGLSISWAEDCADPSFTLRAAEGPGAGGPPVDPRDLILHSRVGLEPTGGKAGGSEGPVRTVPVPTRTPFEVVSSCRPGSIEAWGTNLATSSRVRSRPAPPDLLARVPAGALGIDDVPRMVPGETAPEPRLLAPPAAETVTLGPGDVAIDGTRVFESRQRVEVAAGTRLRMGPLASLVFLGPVALRGTAKAPIVVEGATAEPWGGIAIQGRATAGSVLEHVIVRGGTRPSWRMIPYPGTVDIHDTERVALRHCRLGGNAGADDLLHAVYVDDLLLEDCVIEDAAADAADLEFVEGVLRRVELLRSGDDGLDLMGSRIDLVDAVIVGCAGNAVSAGEETEARVLGSLLAGCKVGVLAKNASTVALAGTLLYGDEVGVRVYKRTTRYGGDSRIEADALWVVGCGRPSRTDDDSVDALSFGRVELRARRGGGLDHLLEDVLGLGDLEEIGPFVASRLKEAGR